MLILLALLAAAGTATELHVGNSYTFFNTLPEVRKTLHEAAVPESELEVTMVARGGAQLYQFADEVDNDAGELADRLRGGVEFDRLFLQEQSQIPGFDRSNPAWTSSRDGIARLRATLPDADMVMLATWGRRDGDERNLARYPDFQTMNDLLDSGTLALVEGLERTWVAPAGRAFAAVRADLELAGKDPDAEGSLFRRLYTDDGSHPSPLGTMLTACVEIGTVSGIGCDAGVAWPLDATAEEREALALAAAAVTVDAPFDDLAWPWAHEQNVFVPGDPMTLGPFEHRPAVRISSELLGDRLAVPGPLGARLYLTDGGALTLRDASTAGVLDIAVTGGSLTVLGGVPASLQATGGTVELGAKSEVESLSMQGEAQLLLSGQSVDSAPTTTFASLDGRVTLLGDPLSDGGVLLSGTRLTYGPEFSIVGLPEGWIVDATETLLVVGPPASGGRCSTVPVPAGVTGLLLMGLAWAGCRKRGES